MNKTKTVMFQGIECVIGYKSIISSSYYGTNLNDWFTSVLPIKTPSKYKKGSFFAIADCHGAYTYGNNTYKCYLPIEHNLSFKTEGSMSYVIGDVIYISNEIINFNPNCVQNIDYKDLAESWDDIDATDKQNTIRYNLKNFDIDKHWSGLKDELKKEVITHQVFNFNIDKYWNELTNSQRDLVCMYQIYNFNITKYKKTFTEIQKSHIFSRQTHNLHIGSYSWDYIEENLRQNLCFYYNKKYDAGYEKINGEWRVMLHPVQDREKN